MSTFKCSCVSILSFKITCKRKENRFSLNAGLLRASSLGLKAAPTSLPLVVGWLHRAHLTKLLWLWEDYTKQKTIFVKFCFVCVFLNKTSFLWTMLISGSELTLQSGRAVFSGEGKWPSLQSVLANAYHSQRQWCFRIKLSFQQKLK